MSQASPEKIRFRLSQGDLIDERYQVISKLGGTEGSAFLIYEVTTSDGPVRALKLIPAMEVKNEQMTMRFDREYKILRHLRQSPRVVAAYAKGTWDRDGWLIPYFVMERLGRSLRWHLKERGGKLPWPEAVGLTRQLAEGLCGVHQREVVHRDLKPENCLFDAHGELVIIDFGISSWSDVPDDPGITTWFQTQHRPAMFGTAGYRAPEVVDHSQPMTPRFDVFTLGIMLYELCLGELPFTPSNEPTELEPALRRGPRRKLGGELRLAPGLLGALVDRMLAFQALERPSAAEVLADLRDLCTAALSVSASAFPVLQRGEPLPAQAGSPARALGRGPERQEPTQLLRIPEEPVVLTRPWRLGWWGLAALVLTVGVVVQVGLRDPRTASDGGDLGEVDGAPGLSPPAADRSGVVSNTDLGRPVVRPAKAPLETVERRKPPSRQPTQPADPLPAVIAAPSVADAPPRLARVKLSVEVSSFLLVESSEVIDKSTLTFRPSDGWLEYSLAPEYCGKKILARTGALSETFTLRCQGEPERFTLRKRPSGAP